MPNMIKIRILAQVVLLCFFQITYGKNISKLFKTQQTLQNSKEVVFLQLMQTDFKEKTFMKIYFNDQYLYIIAIVNAKFSSHIDENRLCANYKIGFKTFNEEILKSTWNEKFSTDCYCLHSPVCKPGNIAVYKRVPQHPLEIEITVYAPEEKYESFANITLIPTFETSTNSCVNGMQPFNYHYQNSILQLCPVRFNELDVPLITQEKILAMIGAEPKKDVKEEPKTNHWPAYLAVLLIVFIALALLLIFVLKRKRDYDSTDNQPLLDIPSGYIIQNSTLLTNESNLRIYKIGLKNFAQELYFYRVEILETIPSLKKQEITLMMVGLKNHGKSTLINGFVDFLCGVKFSDNFRFKLQTPDEAIDQIVMYEMWSTDNIINSRPIVVNIIDVPSLESNRDDHNENIIEKIEKFLQDSSRNIDALCFVANWGSNDFNERNLKTFSRVKALENSPPESYLLSTFVGRGKRGSARQKFVDYGLVEQSHVKEIETSALYKDNASAEEVEINEPDWTNGMNSLRKVCEQVIKFQKPLVTRIAKSINPSADCHIDVTPEIISHEDMAEYKFDYLRNFELPQVETVSLAFVGFKSAGKTTLIQSIINVDLGLSFDHRNLQLRLHTEERPHHVILVKIPALIGSRANFNLHIYDVESFEEDNAEHNDVCLNHLSQLFESHKLDSICFVINPEKCFENHPEFSRVYRNCCQIQTKIIQLMNMHKKDVHYRNELPNQGRFLIDNFAFVYPEESQEFDFDKSVQSYEKFFQKIPDLVLRDSPDCRIISVISSINEEPGRNRLGSFHQGVEMA